MTRARVVGPILTDPTSVNGLTETIIPALQAATLLVQSNLATETSARQAAVTALTTALGSEATTARAAEDALGVRIDTETTDRQTAITTVTDALTAENTRATTAEVALGIRIDNVISNTDATAIDSLVEVVTYFHEADNNLQQAILDLGGAAGSGLSTETTNRTAADTALGVRIDTLTTNTNTAITTLTDSTTANLAQAVTDLEAFATNAATLGGSKSIIEDLIVSGDAITLSHKPKDGWFSVTTGQVEYVNGPVGYKIEVFENTSVTSGKEYKLSVSAGSYDGKQVRIQYLYVSNQ
jgi:hypothetical protein